MRFINQHWSWEQCPANACKLIEAAARTCYQSEPKGQPGELLKRLIKLGHHSVIEHVSASVRIVTNRGVTHEIVRHRLASYSQESTRYCDYGGDDVVFIRPVWIISEDGPDYYRFYQALRDAEIYYQELRTAGWTPQQAREVLPNALKTEIVMSANLREWRHFFTLRCSPKAHPQMQALALDMLLGFHKGIPRVFDDIYEMIHAE